MSETVSVRPEIYHIMFQDECVADIILPLDKDKIQFIKYAEDGIKQPFSGNKLDLERFYRFLKSRCYEDGRADLKEILTRAHMTENNPYEWVRITHGVTWEDFFWIKFDDEQIEWKDVRLRE